jgi:hypothetical protein
MSDERFASVWDAIEDTRPRRRAAPGNVSTLEPDDDFVMPLPRPRFTVEPSARPRPAPRPGRAARIPTVAWTRQTIG